MPATSCPSDGAEPGASLAALRGRCRQGEARYPRAWIGVGRATRQSKRWAVRSISERDDDADSMTVGRAAGTRSTQCRPRPRDRQGPGRGVQGPGSPGCMRWVSSRTASGFLVIGRLPSAPTGSLHVPPNGRRKDRCHETYGCQRASKYSCTRCPCFFGISSSKESGLGNMISARTSDACSGRRGV
jgi:hypothetical protein